MRATRGFTLIEAIISIGLGSMIVAVAMGALRASAHANAVCARLSIENALMRAGVAAAHDELDYWRGYDDPDAVAAARPLRPTGLPFAPLRGAFPGTGRAEDEASTGWDPDPAAWSPHRPETWYRGNLAEKARSDGRFGRYALLANRGGAIPVGDALAAYGTSRGEHGWYTNQVAGLADALGFAGMCDYLPANAIVAWHEARSPATNDGGVPLACLVAGTGLCQKPNWEDDLDVARGLFSLTQFASYIVPNPGSRPAPSPATLLADARTAFPNDFTTVIYPDHRDAMRAMLVKTASPAESLPIRPAGWPAASVTVRRYIKRARFTNACAVRCVSPVTGETTELAFTGIGTSLRGARQQRAPDGGWARWDNAVRGPDRARVDSGNGPCLDSY